MALHRTLAGSFDAQLAQSRVHCENPVAVNTREWFFTELKQPELSNLAAFILICEFQIAFFRKFGLSYLSSHSIIDHQVVREREDDKLVRTQLYTRLHPTDTVLIPPCVQLLQLHFLKRRQKIHRLAHRPVRLDQSMLISWLGN